jgi:glycosyltransferase involved in cell wall biosynthesis
MDKISIIIPAKNEEQILEKCLTALRDSLILVDNEFEIIVVADSCSDNTVEIAQQFACKIEKVDFKNRSKSRNHGFKTSTGEIIVFIDADTLVSKNFMQKTIEILDMKDKSVIYYKQNQIEEKCFSKIYFKLINFIGLIRPTFTPSISCTRTFFSENRFDDKLKSLEDLMFMSNAHRLKQSFYCNSIVYTSIRRYTKFGLIYSAYLLVRSFINPYKYEWKPIN